MSETLNLRRGAANSSRGLERRRTAVIGRLGYAIAALVFAAIAAAAPAAAHPHAWIDLRSTVILDGEGRAVAIEQHWLFDEFYTLFVLEGLKPSRDDRASQLTNLARTNLENLRPYGYFTEVRSGSHKVKTGIVTEFDMELRDGRLWLRFVLPFDRPLDPKTDHLVFSIFDPTYYIEILHLKDDIVTFRGTGAQACSGRVIAPNPTTEAVMLAAALDKDAKATDTLGALFAETVEVECR